MLNHPSIRRSGRRQLAAIFISLPLWLLACEQNTNNVDPPDATFAATTRGQQIFRYDTFGDEEFWTNTLRMHEVIEEKVSPTLALSVGLKVDSDALPPGILDNADLNDPATTVALIKLNAVVGIQGKVDKNNRLTSVGITCALCHSTVDNSVMPGIGKRLDGWANRDLDVGSIIALSPEVEEPAKTTYDNWDPGFYDPRFNIDGEDTPLVIPHVYRRRSDFVLERVRGGDADARSGDVHRSAARYQRGQQARPRDTEAETPARIPVEPAGARAAGGLLRRGGRG
jgi:hypothetical protein